MDLSFLPLVNACLNGTALVLLIIGYVLIRQKRIDAHKRTMIAAFATSCLFLVSYVTHYVWRASATLETHTQFNGTGAIKTAYLLMLLTHIVLAMIVPVLAVYLVATGLKRRDEKHRRVAKWALPIWVYVSITGVLIYLMLYPLNPLPAG